MLPIIKMIKRPDSYESASSDQSWNNLRKSDFINFLLLLLTDYYKPSNSINFLSYNTVGQKSDTGLCRLHGDVYIVTCPQNGFREESISFLVLLAKLTSLALQGWGAQFLCFSVRGLLQLLEATSFLGLWPPSSVFKTRNSRLSFSHVTYL